MKSPIRRFEMNMNSFPTPGAYKRASDLGTTMFYMGSIMSFLAKSEDTAGRFALMEFQSQPGTEPPAHYHAWENELCYVIEGEIESYCEDKVLTAGPGETVFWPQGKPHAFYIRSPFLRMLILVQATGEHAVGLDGYFTAMAQPATSMVLPTDAVTYIMDDPNHVVTVGAAHGIHILSPEDTVKALPHYPGFGVVSKPVV
jgi:quercetin dioxygenase-like cupin family protein